MCLNIYMYICQYVKNKVFLLRPGWVITDVDTLCSFSLPALPRPRVSF